MAKSTALDAGQNAPQKDRAHGPIDMEHLGRQALGDAGLQEEVLRLYARMSQVYLDRIEASTSIPMLLEHLHTLKSAAAGIGWALYNCAVGLFFGSLLADTPLLAIAVSVIVAIALGVLVDLVVRRRSAPDPRPPDDRD